MEAMNRKNKYHLVKVNREDLFNGGLSETGNHNQVKLGSMLVFRKPNFPIGKVVLSVRTGKKRVLIKGEMIAIPVSSPYTGLEWELLLTPSSPVQVEKARKLGLID